MTDEATARLRYSNVAIFLHWAIALLILFNLLTGFLHDIVPRAVFAFHISSGVTILVLTVIRIGWRLTHWGPTPIRPPTRPGCPTSGNGWTRRSAKARCS